MPAMARCTVVSTTPPARRLRPDETPDAVTAIHEAFTSEPTLRWVWPDDERWRTVGRTFVEHLVEVRLSGGEPWVTEDKTAVALWDPPGGIYLTRPGLWEQFTPMLTSSEAARLEHYDRLADQLQPPQPRWYLGVLAVRPGYQGQGRSRIVLEPILAAADRTGAPATLETSTPANVTIYARFGFDAYAESDLPDGPHMWVLRRSPRP